MSSTLLFRSASLQDIPAILVLVHSAYRGETSRLGWTTEADLLEGQRTDEDELRSMIEAREARTRVVLGFFQDELVASMLLDPRPDHVHVGMVAVRPDRQALGIGRRLLEHAEQVARAERLGAVLRMTVIAQRLELLRWYERRGFLPTGERAPFPYGEVRFGLPLRPDLHFLVLEKRL